MLRDRACLGRRLLGQSGVVGNVIDADGNLFDRCCRRRQRFGLPFGFRRDSARHGVQGVETGVQGGRIFADFDKHRVQARDEPVERRRRLPDLIVRRDGQLSRQVGIAAGNFRQCITQAEQSLEQAGECRIRQERAENGNGQAGEQQHGQQGLQGREDRRLVDDGAEYPVDTGDRGCDHVLVGAADRQFAQRDLGLGGLQDCRVEAGQHFGHRLEGRLRLGVRDDLAVARGEESVAVAAQFDGLDQADDLLERDVTADHGTAIAFDRTRDRDAELLRAGREVRRGDGRALGFAGLLVPGARRWVVAIRRFLVGEVIDHPLVRVADEQLVEPSGILAGNQEGNRVFDTGQTRRDTFDGVTALGHPARQRFTVPLDGRLDFVADAVDNLRTHTPVGHSGQGRDDHQQQDGDKGQ